jgi:nicotinamidase-related amidase
MRPGTDGVQIHPLVAPRPDEPVVTKAEPNAFLDTDLEQLLRDQGVDQLVVVGMETYMCVDSTVRTGAELGFSMHVVPAACATSDVEFGDTPVPGRLVHAAFLAGLADGFAEIVDVEGSIRLAGADS